MKLLERFCVQERGELMDNDVRLTTIGDVDRLPASTRAKLDETIALTRDNRGTALVLALSYGARDEIARAARRLAREAAEGRVDPERIDEAAFAARLDTAGLPDPDLLVRTSGEMRLSNFLLWQLAYAELHVTDVLWPDFRRRHLLEAVIDYQGRERRFGGVDSTDVEPPAASNPPA
jgi:undecaprenyl diphosphate synthase